MRTKDSVIKERHEYQKLINAVIRRVGSVRDLKDVAEHGADSGFPGFIYYTDTMDFFRRHKKDIVALAEELADELGESVISMVQSFKYLDADEKEIAQTLYGIKPDTQVANAMAWFALEEVANWFNE